jgi:DNA-directed RNA polymerase specialized sigma24 family protein
VIETNAARIRRKRSELEMSRYDSTVITDSVRPGDVGGLVIGAADGDDDAWQELVTRYSDLVSSVTGAHHLNEADVARVSARVWRRLGRQLGKIRQPDRVGAWLGAVTRDECVKALATSAHHAA